MIAHRLGHRVRNQTLERLTHIDKSRNIQTKHLGYGFLALEANDVDWFDNFDARFLPKLQSRV